jgi:hypothetical protein
MAVDGQPGPSRRRIWPLVVAGLIGVAAAVIVVLLLVGVFDDDDDVSLEESTPTAAEDQIDEPTAEPEPETPEPEETSEEEPTGTETPEPGARHTVPGAETSGT